MEENEDKLAAAGSGAKVRELIEEFRRCSPMSGNWDRVATNEAVRFAQWPNQTPDGKKHSTSTAEAFPWEGASDMRCMAADDVINDNVAIAVTAFFRSMLQTKAGQSEASNYSVKLVDYLMNTLLTEELMNEVELAIQYQETYGWFVLHPHWVYEIELENRTVTLQELVGVSQQVAQQNPESPLAQLPAMIMDTTMDEATAAVLGTVYEMYAKQQEDLVDIDLKLPPLRPARLKKAVKELRENGEAAVPLPYVCENRPCIIALKPWDEVFLSASCTDIKKARVVFRRDWLTEAELRSRVMVEGWSEAWVTEALKQKGKMSNNAQMFYGSPPTTVLSGTGAAQVWESMALKEELVEVIWATYRQLDADNVPGVFFTVFNPNVCEDGLGKELCADHGLLEGTRGKMPYVAGKRERPARAITASRGVPEIMSTWQAEVKAQRDGIRDLTGIAVHPPLLKIAGAQKASYKFGPGVEWTVMPGREPKFMEMPERGASLAFELIAAVRSDIDNYFGRTSELVPPTRSQTKQQLMVSQFLTTWTAALRMAVALCQEHMPDAEFAAATGAPEGWLVSHRKDKGLGTSGLHFDVRELDPEFVMKQLAAINATVLPSDTMGVVDRSKYTKLQLMAINPAMAKELVADQAAASQQIFSGVQQDIALMFLGNEPQYVEMDPTAQTKLKFAEQIVGSNPTYQQALKQGGRFGELMKKWSENLQFSLTQQQNKMVGRIGVSPGQGAGADAGVGR